MTPLSPLPNERTRLSQVLELPQVGIHCTTQTGLL